MARRVAAYACEWVGARAEFLDGEVASDLARRVLNPSGSGQGRTYTLIYVRREDDDEQVLETEPSLSSYLDLSTDELVAFQSSTASSSRVDS